MTNVQGKNKNLIVKNKHNVGLKNLNFEFLADGGGFKLKKKTKFFFQIFLSYQKIPLVDLVRDVTTGKFLVRPLPCNGGAESSPLVGIGSLGRIANITKILQILYQLIKLFLNSW